MMCICYYFLVVSSQYTTAFISIFILLSFMFCFVSCSQFLYASTSYSGGVNYLCGLISISVSSIVFPILLISFCIFLFIFNFFFCFLLSFLSSSSVTNFCIFCHKFVSFYYLMFCAHVLAVFWLCISVSLCY